MIIFKNNEDAYQEWCEQHKDGYVFNHFGGNKSEYNVVHHVQCRTLWIDKYADRRTVIEKWCDTELEELVRAVEGKRRNSFKYCSVCLAGKAQITG